MASDLRFRILTPAREVWSGEVESVTLTALEGAIGVLPGHAPLLAQLRPGEASIRAAGQTHWFALADGFVEVADDVVIAVVRAGVRADETASAPASRRGACRGARGVSPPSPAPACTALGRAIQLAI